MIFCEAASGIPNHELTRRNHNGHDLVHRLPGIFSRARTVRSIRFNSKPPALSPLTIRAIDGSFRRPQRAANRQISPVICISVPKPGCDSHSAVELIRVAPQVSDGEGTCLIQEQTGEVRSYQLSWHARLFSASAVLHKARRAFAHRVPTYRVRMRRQDLMSLAPLNRQKSSRLQ